MAQRLDKKLENYIKIRYFDVANLIFYIIQIIKEKWSLDK